MRLTKQYINDIAYKIVGCAIEVHKILGLGLLESIYEECFIEELIAKGISVQNQVYCPLYYKGRQLSGRLKLDLLVEDLIIVELKATENMIPLYKAQLLSYLTLIEKPKDLLINFHCENITKELVSLVTPAFAILPEN